MFCSNQLGNSRQMDLSSPGIDVKLKEKKKKDNEREGPGKEHSCKRMTKEINSTKTYGVLFLF